MLSPHIFLTSHATLSQNKSHAGANRSKCSPERSTVTQKTFLGPCGIIFGECYSHSADGRRHWNSADSLGDSNQPPQPLRYCQLRQLQPRLSGSPLPRLSSISVEQQPGRAKGRQTSNTDQKKTTTKTAAHFHR